MKTKNSIKQFISSKLIIAICLMVAFIVALTLPFIHHVEKNRYPKKFSVEVEYWANEFDLDSAVIYSVIRTESHFNPQAQSNVGAIGLMQITPETFYWLKSRLAPNELIDAEDLFEPNVNIRFGAYLLHLSLERYNNDYSTAFAAYHSGWGTVDQLLQDDKYSENGLQLNAFPYRQMRHYVNKVNRSLRKYTNLYFN